MKLSHATLLLTSRDRVTQQVARRALDKESSQRRAQFKPATYSRNIMAKNPGAHRRVLLNHVKNTANVEDATSKREQAKALPLQGQMLRASNLTADGIWAVAVSKLGSEAMKFALNAALDTLPPNSNLTRWYRGSCINQCKLCGKKQTLLHVLNNCEVALNLRRYNMRHDRILQLIVTAAQAYSPVRYQLVADLPVDQYHFPSHITPTDLRPDIVLWSNSQRTLNIIELTVSYETGFEEAADRKTRRYGDLVEEVGKQGNHCQTISLQVGSRGVIHGEGLNEFRCCLKPIPNKEWKKFLIGLTTAAIEESHHIWSNRNHKKSTLISASSNHFRGFPLFISVHSLLYVPIFVPIFTCSTLYMSYTCLLLNSITVVFTFIT